MVGSESTGRHVVLRHLAEGGMGELFLARAQAAGGVERLVVLKRIRSGYCDDPEFVRMFLNECRLAATLQHPNIVTVYDVGCEDGEYYYSMEYIHGEPLSRILGAAERRGGVPLVHALTIAVGMTAGLQHAHRQRGLDGRPLEIVHRDLSPSNVLVTYEGVVKIVDFGLARAASLTRVTPHGVRKGKAAYMSPEQAVGDEVDARSDVFAVGVLLYELTTLKRAFKGRTPFEIVNQVAGADVVPPTERVPGYPPVLESIVMRALARDPARRFASARELHRALEHFAATERLAMSSVELGEFVVSRLGERAHPTTAEPELSQLVAGRTEVSRAPERADAHAARWRGWPLWAAAAGGLGAAGMLSIALKRSPATEPDLSDSSHSTGPAAIEPDRSPPHSRAHSAPTPAPAEPVEEATPPADPSRTPGSVSEPPEPSSTADAVPAVRPRRRAPRRRRPRGADSSPRSKPSSANALLPGG